MMVMSHEVDTSNYQVLLRHVVATVYSVTYVALCYRMLAFALLWAIYMYVCSVGSLFRRTTWEY